MKIINKSICYLILFTPLLHPVLFLGFNIGIKNLTGLITFIYIILILNKKKTVPKYCFYALLFCLYIAFDQWFLETENIFTLKYWYSNDYLQFIAMAIILESMTIEPKTIKNFIRIFKLYIISGLVISIIQLVFNPSFFTYLPFLPMNNPEYENLYHKIILSGRYPSVFGFLGSDNFTRIFPLLVSCFLGFYLINKKKIPSIYIGLSAIIILISRWRIAYLCFIIVISQIVKKGKVKKIVGVTVVLFVIIGLFFNLVEYLGLDVHENFGERIMSDSGLSRLYAFSWFWQVFPQKPLFGTGGVKEKELLDLIEGKSYGIHVGYLSLFYHWGLIGGTFFLLLCWHLYQRFYLCFKRTNFTGALWGIISYLCINLTDFEFDFNKIGIYFLIIFTVFYEKQKNSTENRVNKNALFR